MHSETFSFFWMGLFSHIVSPCAMVISLFSIRVEECRESGEGAPVNADRILRNWVCNMARRPQAGGPYCTPNFKEWGLHLQICLSQTHCIHIVTYKLKPAISSLNSFTVYAWMNPGVLFLKVTYWVGFYHMVNSFKINNLFLIICSLAVQTHDICTFVM